MKLEIAKDNRVYYGLEEIKKGETWTYTDINPIRLSRAVYMHWRRKGIIFITTKLSDNSMKVFRAA
jgi:hypothetical protein